MSGAAACFSFRWKVQNQLITSGSDRAPSFKEQKKAWNGGSKIDPRNEGLLRRCDHALASTLLLAPLWCNEILFTESCGRNKRSSSLRTSLSGKGVALLTQYPTVHSIAAGSCRRSNLPHVVSLTSRRRTSPAGSQRWALACRSGGRL